MSDSTITLPITVLFKCEHSSVRIRLSLHCISHSSYREGIFIDDTKELDFDLNVNLNHLVDPNSVKLKQKSLEGSKTKNDNLYESIEYR